MISSGSFIKVPKELLASSLYEDKELFHLCITLISLERFLPGKIDNVELEAGQLLTTGRYLCERCSITRAQLRRYLDYLSDCGFITKKGIGHKYTLITINHDARLPKTINGIKC